LPRSMTGYARAQTQSERYALAVSVRSVNHRYLDVQMRLPPEIEAFEMAGRQRIKQRVARGFLHVNASVEIRGAGELKIRRDLVEGYIAAHRELARQYGLAGEPDLAVLFRLPGIVALGDATGAPDGELEQGWLQTLDRALTELAAVRDREGVQLVHEMRERSNGIDAHLERIEALRVGLAPALLNRLRTRLADLIPEASVDPGRLLQEAALVAERSDISEEVERLRVHNRQLRELLATDGEAGKRLDFLLQEMNREANTVVSKTSGIGGAGLEITDLGLALKAEIEKIREQAMNLE